ncbi:MFS transporter [Streptomyces sp. AK02-01A]|uniref:MFS transporter n=1 Tax=Streptomyces sp. AK02-01A TaxID=3028648 RepID=UPI0029B93602|nr:MFS transporter [Streptomyces sp. AK02-01A]MDX3851836.1 MFS transporter [Streptomyces sp. AK02-01A]
MKGPSSSSSQGPAWVTLLLVSLAVFLVPVALTGAGVALPDIASDLRPSAQSLQWVISGYNVMFASLMLAFGALADRVGRRRVFQLGVVLFGLGALVATLAGSIVVLDIARAVAGIGAGATLTSGSTLIAARFEGTQRIRAFGIFGTALGAGLAFGPLVSGLMLSALGWRGVFAIPAVLGLLVAAFSPVLKESRNPHARPLDWPGTITFTGALFLLIFALVEAPAYGWGSGLVIGSLAGFALLLTGFVVAEHRQKAPMFDLALLRYPRFMAVNATAMALAFTLLPLLVLLPTYFSAVEGFSALHAGAILVLFTAPTLVIPLLASRMTRWFSLRTLLASAMALVAAGMAWLTVIEPGVGVGTLAGPLLIAGTGYGMTLAVLDGAAVSSVELARAGMASGMFNALRLTADTAAAAVGGSLMISVTAARLAGRVTDSGAVTDALNAGLHTTSAEAAAAFTGALHVVIWVGGALALVTVPVLLRTLRPRQDEGIGVPVARNTLRESESLPQPESVR